MAGLPATALTDVIGRALGGGANVALVLNGETPMTASPKTPSTSASSRKIDQVFVLLGRKQGATLAEITELTGWLPHTARAALTGLRKKGQTITKAKRDEVTTYSIQGQS